MTDTVEFKILMHLLASLVAGGLIGLERSYQGRPAGFRTHVLVCVSASMLMLVTLYQSVWYGPDIVHAPTSTDPTRMAQGIMTGIGFLGAGVIVKEGLSVRGLTTAASIWITAAIGILAGIGFYYPLVVSVVLTLGVLSLFRWIESAMPTQAYFHFAVRFTREAAMAERELRELVRSHGFSIANFTYRLEEGRVVRHTMVIRSADRAGAGRLAVTLEKNPAVIEFRIAPTGD
jgi:putative Mg2+ transporter-C (MgtC) family protein